MTDGVWQTARIVRIQQQTPRIKSFFLELPWPFHFQPGQHVDVRLTAPDGYQAKRSYSIASAPDATGTIELAIDRLDNGEVSSFFHEIAAAGDDIELRGPLGGHFVWRPRDGGPVLLVAGGSGVVPFMSMIRAWLAEASTVPVALLLSAISRGQAPYLEELATIAAGAPGFSFRLALTQEPPINPLDYGRRVDAAMIGDVLRLLSSPPAKIFVCGSNGFANTASEALEVAGVPSEIIRTERYGG